MHHAELRSLFFHYAEQSRQFSSDLSTWRSAYGYFGRPEKKVVGSVWAPVVSLLDHWLRKNVASKCEEMEQDALKMYRTANHWSFIPAAAAADIERQSREFEKALTKLRTLREQAGNNVSVREELVHTPAF